MMCTDEFLLFGYEKHSRGILLSISIDSSSERLLVCNKHRPLLLLETLIVFVPV